MAHQVVVLKSGRVVEQGAADQVLASPQHEYTRTLVQAFPDLT
jgi:ABC-type microcin C transport system duplicated ATPase subunit YejF